MAQILDYSAGYPGAAAIRAAGYQGVIRYLHKEGTSSVRPLTPAEATDMRTHDRTLALVYQHVDRWRTSQGRTAGRHDALWALAQAKACGIERPRAIYFAVDHDTSPEQWPAIREYMLGAGEILGLALVGCYGEYDLLDYLVTRVVITWLWQTYAWSTGHNKDTQPRHPKAHLFQRLGQITINGIPCDVNDVLKTDHGQIQIQIQEEDDMAWLDELVPDPATGQPKQDKWGNTYTWRTALAYAPDAVWAIHDRPVADVDEAALAAELHARGIGGVTAAELVDILASIRLTPTPGGGS